MTVELGINHLMAQDTAPVPFIEIAAQAGASAVSLFVNRMGPDSHFPVVTRADTQAVRQALSDHGLRIGNLDPFALSPTTDVPINRNAPHTGTLFLCLSTDSPRNQTNL